MKNYIKNASWMVILLISIVVLIYSIVMLYNTQKEYKRIDEVNKEIVSLYTENNEEDSTEDFSIDWESLLSINNEIIAWIRIPDTKINYPIIQSDNNNKYLRCNIYGNYSYGGCIFVDSAIEKPFNNLNTIIYGHNINNGSMFSGLKEYKNEDYALKHREIYIYLPSGTVKIYKVFSFSKTNENNYDIYNTSVEDLRSYYETIKKYNQLTIDKEVDVSKPILTLSTCTNKNRQERYVIQAYLEQ